MILSHGNANMVISYAYGDEFKKKIKYLKKK